jgi:putative peptidoglycan lipid II flippase
MLRSLLSVSGFTMISRVTGFARDVMMAAAMGAGPLSDAFLIAFRLPNHFRAIFAEGAFNAAFVPQYSKMRQTEGEDAAQRFADDMMSWQFLIQAGLLAIALIAMPLIVAALAPGFTDDPSQMDLAVVLTRITFGYLLCVTLVTQLSAMLNARGFFKAAAAAPVLLNLAMMAALAVAFIFPTAAHAAAWGVLAGGIAEIGLLVLAARWAGVTFRIKRPENTPDVRRFLVTFWPAALGSMGVQIALFADTILASFLPGGELTSLYYADRINQLPLGVIGVALGTVLLPEMSRRLAAGDIAGSSAAQNRAVELGLLMTLPFAALFIIIPDLIMLGLFSRGAFDAQAAAMAASVLSIYAFGLPAFILIRTVTPIFHARGDTATPVKATFAAIAINLGVKVWAIVGLGWGAEGLALGTSIGAWVNFGILFVLARSSTLLDISARLRRQILGTALAVGGMAVVVLLSLDIGKIVAGALPGFGHEAALAYCGFAAIVAYGLAAWALGLFRGGR